MPAAAAAVGSLSFHILMHFWPDVAPAAPRNSFDPCIKCISDGVVIICGQDLFMDPSIYCCYAAV